MMESAGAHSCLSIFPPYLGTDPRQEYLKADNKVRVAPRGGALLCACGPVALTQNRPQVIPSNCPHGATTHVFLRLFTRVGQIRPSSPGPRKLYSRPRSAKQVFSSRDVMALSAASPLHKSDPLARSLLLILALGALVSTGCLRRRLTVRSNPPGALVYVDDQEIGTTPVSTSFIYYGTRKIRLVRDGFETLTVLHRFRPPWYELPPLDFVTENIWPSQLRDERALDFQLVPKRVVPRYELLGRAENLRHGSREGYVAPLPNAPRPETGSLLESVPPPRPNDRSPQDTYNPNLALPPPPPPRP